MAFQYSGWIEVPKSPAKGGGTVRIPFTFQSTNILERNERREYLNELFNTWKALLSDYDASREGEYGEMTNHRFTSIEDLGFGPAEGDPHFGK